MLMVFVILEFQLSQCAIAGATLNDSGSCHSRRYKFRFARACANTAIHLRRNLALNIEVNS